MQRMHRLRFLGALMFAVTAITTTADTAAQSAPAPPATTPAPAAPPDGPPPAGHASISFLRPVSPDEGLVKHAESVWEIVDDKPVFVGVLKSRQRINYAVQPGTHLFMAVGETAEFMTADIGVDRTYYAVLTGKMGTWKPRFWLRPIHQSEFGSKEFADALSACALIEKSPKDDAWAAANTKTVEARRAASFATWQRKAEVERPGLLPVDGR